MRYHRTVLILVLLGTAAAAQTQEHAPVALKSAHKMSQEGTKSENWTYIDPAFHQSRFNCVYVPPTAIYRGADAQFPGTTEADKQRFANILTTTVKGELSKAFDVSDSKRANCLTMQMSLIGIQETRGGIATATRVTPIGFALSSVKQLTGKRGSFTGSMLVAVEMTRGNSNKLLVAAVRRRAPDALDIESTLSTTDTVHAVSREIGENLRNRLLANGTISRVR